jgi:hypothetical protein
MGFFLGFLFGIPKVLQGNRATTLKPSTTSTPYGQRVNTNLEDISDWLTKIIVGLGIYELRRIPAWMGMLANYFATGHYLTGPLSFPLESAFSAAIVFFTICGFLLGYLITRIYLQRALAHADKNAVPDDDASLPKATEPVTQETVYPPKDMETDLSVTEDDAETETE